MKKVTILALHLGYGGIEKSIATLANMLVSDYDVEIISCYKLYDEPAFKLDPKVHIRYLITKYRPNREKWIQSIKDLKLVTFIKESFNSVMTLHLRKKEMVNAIRECNSDIIIATRDIFDDWLGKYGKGKTYKIGWEHNHYHGDMDYANKIVSSCKNLDALVLVSDSLKSFYKAKLKEYKCKCYYIPNTLDYVPKTLSSLSTKRLVSVGRLSKEKAYGDLLDIFEIIHKKDPSWRLDIVGDGAQKNLLGDRIFNEDLKDSVKIHGYQDKDYINKLLADSSIYLMSSVTESFGIVLIEAMSFGLPCVAFSSAEGAKDLIKDGVNGYLIEGRCKEGYARKVLSLMNDRKLRCKMGAEGRKVSLNYTEDIVKKEWLKLLKKKG